MLKFHYVNGLPIYFRTSDETYVDISSVKLYERKRCVSRRCVRYKLGISGVIFEENAETSAYKQEGLKQGDSSVATVTDFRCSMCESIEKHLANSLRQDRRKYVKTPCRPCYTC
jgi:hypothetical protein